MMNDDRGITDTLFDSGGRNELDGEFLGYADTTEGAKILGSGSRGVGDKDKLQDIPDSDLKDKSPLRASVAIPPQGPVTQESMSEAIVLKRMCYSRYIPSSSIGATKKTGITKRCKWAEGCEKHAAKGGFCISHGGKHGARKCKHPDGCERVSQKGGMCKRHFKLHMQGLQEAISQIQAPEIATAAASAAEVAPGSDKHPAVRRLVYKNQMEALEDAVMHHLQAEGGKPVPEFKPRKRSKKSTGAAVGVGVGVGIEGSLAADSDDHGKDSSDLSEKKGERKQRSLKRLTGPVPSPETDFVTENSVGTSDFCDPIIPELTL